MSDHICCCKRTRFPLNRTVASDRTMNWQGIKEFSRFLPSPVGTDIWTYYPVVALQRMFGSAWVDGDCTVLWIGHSRYWCCKRNLDPEKSLHLLDHGLWPVLVRSVWCSWLVVSRLVHQPMCHSKQTVFRTAFLCFDGCYPVELSILSCLGNNISFLCQLVVYHGYLRTDHRRNTLERLCSNCRNEDCLQVDWKGSREKSFRYLLPRIV